MKNTQQIKETTRKNGEQSIRQFSHRNYAIAISVLLIVIYIAGSGLIKATVFPGSLENSSPTAQLLFQGLGQLLFLLIPALLLSRYQPLPIRELFRFNRTHSGFYVAVLLGGIILQLLGAFYLLVQELYLIPSSLLPSYHSFIEEVDKLIEPLLTIDGFGSLILAFSVIAIIPGITEELIFRGSIQRSFEEDIRPLSAIVITGFIFGLFHLQPHNLIPLSAVGMFFGYVAYHSQSIYPVILGHFTFNSIALVAHNVKDVPLNSIEENPSSESVLMMLPLVLILLPLLSATLLWIKKLSLVQSEDPPTPHNTTYSP